MITLTEALAIHEVLITSTGGANGVRDKGALEAALARPYATFAGDDLYPEPMDKASAVLESIVKNHPFVDGNKRTGYVLAPLTLITHDLDLVASDDEEYDFVIRVAIGELDMEGIRSWLKARVVPVA
ncbi:MAG: type II toxin-antitoxin system death-on-curing family toxin [Flavobacteriales bacterium]|nr:type II toxin-antitoxin system death-on-curing family toxin [Flavobacteriales bacterium]